VLAYDTRSDERDRQLLHEREVWMQRPRKSDATTVGYALGGGLATVPLIGVPTVLLPTPGFGRAISPRPLDRVFLIVTAIL